MEKYSFKNDYSSLIHPTVLRALTESATKQFDGYGLDVHSLYATHLIRKKIQKEDVDIHFVSGGTQANLIVLSSLLRSYEAVISCSSGHIATHETGAIESTGHKVCTVDSTDGKITVSQIKSVVENHTDEHMVKPKVVFISQSTELGTIYSKKELKDIKDYCSKQELYIYMDGARIAAAVNSRESDLSYADIAGLVDVFYLGGTKNGALFGEAIVICNDNLKDNFRYSLKQKGGMLAKGAAIGIQFEALLTDNVYDQNALHANAMAYRLADGITAIGYKLLNKVETNQIFPIFPKEIVKKLYLNYDFHEWADLKGSVAIRLVTSFDTPIEAVDGFITYLKALNTI